MALKENLENFLEQYENMKALCSPLDGSDSFEMEFVHLKQISQRYRTEKVFPTSSGEKDVNMRKNRYKDILPFDHSRFTLSDVDGQEGTDYINANYLKGVNSDHAYLAAQGPLPHTVNDFWRMLWESNAAIIVMACNEFEQGRHKCERYWVDEGEEHTFGDILITQIRQQRVTRDFMIRTLKATRDKEEKIFNQFHYTAWPDHGVPTSVKPILDMIQLIREYQPHEEIPIVVHCSAGCGRTGTICVIDYVRNALNDEKIDANFSLYDITLEMRRQRHAIVQTRNQYELVYRAVATMFQWKLGIKEGDKEDFGHNYENVTLRHDLPDQPRMPPRVPGQNGGDKRDSQSHSYVNCNITSKGAVTMEPELPSMPKLPTAPAKPARGVESTDGVIYANYDVGQASSDGGHDTTPNSTTHDSTGPGGKQNPVAKPRQSPENRYQNNFQATLLAFKDIEVESTQPGAGQPTTTQTQAVARGKPQQAPKPTPPVKPQIADKPIKGTKPNPPLKPPSENKPAFQRSTSSDVTSQLNSTLAKVIATRQDSNGPTTKTQTKENSSPSSQLPRVGERKEALKLPVMKPNRQLDKSKLDAGEMQSPTSSKGAPKAVKTERPAGPPPKPPVTSRLTIQRPNQEDRNSFKGSRHDYEQVNFIAPPMADSSKDDLFSVHPVKSTALDSFEFKDNNGAVKKRTESHRKHSSGSVDNKTGRKNSEPQLENSLEYAYVQQPQSKLDKLLKSEQESAQKSTAAMYATAYAEVTESTPPKPAMRHSSSMSEDYAYVGLQQESSKPVGPEKPPRSESYSDGDYNLVGGMLKSEIYPPDTFNDTAGTYSLVNAAEDYVHVVDDDVGDAPAVPTRTAQSYELVEDDKASSGGGKFTQFKAKMQGSKGFLDQKQTKLATNTKEFFKKIGGALKQETSSHSSTANAETDNPKHHSNIEELLEKTLKEYPPSYREGPVMYKEQDISFPKRVAGPRRPRSPPRNWGVRPGDVRSAPVHL